VTVANVFFIRLSSSSSVIRCVVRDGPVRPRRSMGTSSEFSSTTGSVSSVVSSASSSSPGRDRRARTSRAWSTSPR
jgi:hypothetical protein